MSRRQAEEHFAAVLASLGADPAGDPRLSQTPATFVNLLARFVEPAATPELSLFPVEGDAATVTLRGLQFYSLCEHHVVPFFGTIDVAYEPDRSVAGLGGFQRLVTHFATRLQLQERMTQQVADALENQLLPRGLAVISRARQMCFEMEGHSPAMTLIAKVQRGPHGPALLAQLE